MRLLICTQSVDLDDPVLGFFHRWIAEFSKQCEIVHVICLKEGRHELPSSVIIHSLGKEKGTTRAARIVQFFRLIWIFRNDYDAVFIHMNPEYVCLGGPLWRVLRKRAGLWYVHWATSVRLRIAVLFANVIFTAREDSMRIATRKKKVVGHGIDTEAFKPAPKPARRDSILFLSRLDPVKRVDLFIRALEKLEEENIAFAATIVGRPSETSSKYAHDVRNLAATLVLGGTLAMRDAVTNEEAQKLFAAHAVFCKLSPRGQFDKVMLEAMASGCLVVTTDDDLASVLPPKFIARDTSEVSLAEAMRTAIQLPENERGELSQKLRAWVEREHSLQRLIGRITHDLS